MTSRNCSHTVDGRLYAQCFAYRILKLNMAEGHSCSLSADLPHCQAASKLELKDVSALTVLSAHPHMCSLASSCAKQIFKGPEETYQQTQCLP